MRVESSEPIWICNLINDAGLVPSNGEAGLLVEQSVVKLNSEKMNNADMEIEPVGELIILAGKRRFAKIVFA